MTPENIAPVADKIEGMINKAKNFKKRLSAVRIAEATNLDKAIEDKLS